MFNKLSTPLTKYFYLIVALIVIFAKVTLYNLYLYKTKVEETYHNNNILSQKIAYDSNIDKFSLVSKYIFDKEINKNEILELLDKAMNSNDEMERIANKALFNISLLFYVKL